MSNALSDDLVAHEQRLINDFNQILSPWRLGLMGPYRYRTLAPGGGRDPTFELIDVVTNQLLFLYRMRAIDAGATAEGSMLAIASCFAMNRWHVVG